MANDILFVGWNRAVVGREHDAAELLGSVTNFYEAQKRAGNITGYEYFFLDPHGGDMNGFTIVRGDHAKLAALTQTDEFIAISTKAIVTLEGFGMITGISGDKIQKRMALYLGSVPSRK